MINMRNVTYLCPPKALALMFGQAAGRYLWFIWQAIRIRPEYVGGFHLLCNGLLALLVAKMVRASSLYFCVGGWTEVLGGGAFGENRLFGAMGNGDRVVQRQLAWAVCQFDRVITMGTGRESFFIKSA
jgi:hypothetical protein